MSTPADGFYSAMVTFDTGGEIKTAVRVLGGKVLTVHPYELVSSACRDFQPLPMAITAGFWPQEIGALCEQLSEEVARLRKDDWVGGACLHLMAQHGVPIGSPELLEAKARVEAEISALRTAKAALEAQVKRMVAAGDEMASWLRNPRNLGDDPFMADQWEATKGQP
jgi:hypothetical protein